MSIVQKERNYIFRFLSDFSYSDETTVTRTAFSMSGDNAVVPDCFQILLQICEAFDMKYLPFGIVRMKRGKKVKKKVHSTLKRDLEARAKSEHYR